MNILIFSSLLNAIILFLRYYKISRIEKEIKFFTFLGIVVGICVLGLNYISDSCFGASTPIDIYTENKTEQNLRIYAIVFWNNSWNENGNYVNYDTKLKPNETSKFCIDNDAGKFWLVAKNNKGEIKYLKEISKNESNFKFRITSNKNVEIKKAQIAAELTFKTDKDLQLKKYLVWVNITLIGLLIFKLSKNKKSSNSSLSL